MFTTVEKLAMNSTFPLKDFGLVPAGSTLLLPELQKEVKSGVSLDKLDFFDRSGAAGNDLYFLPGLAMYRFKSILKALWSHGPSKSNGLRVSSRNCLSRRHVGWQANWYGVFLC